MILADIGSREDSSRIQASMTKRQIVLVCAVAGLTMVEGFLTINAIAEGFYNCNPDPNHSETCFGQVIANFAVLIGPWLVATYLLARREAISLFACLLLGWMWALGLFGAVLLDETFRPSPPLDEVGAANISFGYVGAFLVFGFIAMLVIGLLTAVVGSAMQAVIRGRRRRRPTSVSERAHGIATKGRWLVVGTMIVTTLATAGVVAYSHRLEIARAINERIVAVLVFDVDIPAGTDLDQVIKNDQLELVQVPANVIVDGTVTSVDQLSHTRTRVAILAGEPILAEWLRNEAERDSS
jgi:hypothetical protein